MISLHHASCIDWLANYDGPLFDACVTDPPYHLTSIVKRFGGKNAAGAKVGATGAYARASKGFMGKEWDGGDIAFRPETWRAVYDALKPVDLMRWLCRLVTPPGGHILEPFAGSGTTGIAAMAEGFDCSMIELEADHVADIERKLAFLRGEGALTFQEHNHAKALRTKETPLGGLFGEAV